MHLPLSRTMTNVEIAEVLAFIGQLKGMEKNNQFRARAYDEAAVIVRQLPYEVAEEYTRLHAQHGAQAKEVFAAQLEALPGIGKNIAAKLVELTTTGSIAAFQKYVAALPAGMYPLVHLSGLGAKKALKLATAFHLTNASTAFADLLDAARAGKVRDLEGFGEKSEADLIVLLESEHTKSRIPREKALEVAGTLVRALERSPHVESVAILGSLRRQAPTVGDIDLGAVTTNMAALQRELQALPIVARVLAAGEQLVRLVLKNSWQVDIKFVPASEWGSFLQHFTGSKEHNIRLREFALRKGLSLSEHGIKEIATGRMHTFTDEKAFYRFLGLRFIDPSERVGGDEIEKYAL